MALSGRSTVIVLLAVNLSVLCFSANAQTEPSAAITKIDLKTSRVYVLVDKTGLGHQHGVAGRLQGGKLNLGARTKAGQIVFDMASFVADTEEARKYVGLEGKTDAATKKKVNDNMRGPDVLNVMKYPNATFDIDSAIETGKASSSGNPLYELKGSFTLHGVIRPLTVIAEVVSGDQSTHVRGQFKVLQSQFGMKPYAAALGAVGVADELTIWGEIDLKQ